MGGIYDRDVLDQLRGGCSAYIHGHTVGGTNPSLLERSVRREAVSLLQHAPHVVMPRHRTSQVNAWTAYAASPFVLSLAGNGLDCHRTWEALYLGSAVIALHSSLDGMYEGLPIILIDDVTELLDPNRLSEWLARIKVFARPADVRKRLSAPIWVQRLRLGV